MDIWKTKLSFKQLLRYVFAFSFKWAVKFLVVLLLVLYVIVGTGAVSNIVRREINNVHDVSYLKVVIDDALFNDDLENVILWIDYRPLSETAQIIEIIEPYASDINPMLFFEIAFRLVWQGQNDDALFWYMLGKYRFRYDMLRCGAKDSIENLNQFLADFQSEESELLLEIGDVKIKQAIKKVLAFDKKYPPRNAIDYACTLAEAFEKDNKITPLSESDWPHVHDALVRSAQEFVGKK